MCNCLAICTLARGDGSTAQRAYEVTVDGDGDQLGLSHI
jgi:hypothetical protein